MPSCGEACPARQAFRFMHAISPGGPEGEKGSRDTLFLALQLAALRLVSLAPSARALHKAACFRIRLPGTAGGSAGGLGDRDRLRDRLRVGYEIYCGIYCGICSVMMDCWLKGPAKLALLSVSSVHVVLQCASSNPSCQAGCLHFCHQAQACVSAGFYLGFLAKVVGKVFVSQKWLAFLKW